MIAYIALLSALLSKFTALACSSTMKGTKHLVGFGRRKVSNCWSLTVILLNKEHDTSIIELLHV